MRKVKKIFCLILNIAFTLQFKVNWGQYVFIINNSFIQQGCIKLLDQKWE